MVKKYLLSLFCITAGISAAISNKTVLDTVPHVPASTLTALPLKLYLQERSGYRILKGASLQVHADYSSSMHGGAYAEMLSPYGKGKAEIAGASQSYTEMLSDFNFIHSQGLTHGIDATLALNPYFKKAMARAQLFIPINRWLSSCFIEAGATFGQLDYGVNLSLSGARTSCTVDGGSVSIAEYFAGTLTQKNTETQSALAQATFGQKHSKKGLGEVTLAFGHKRSLGKESFFSPYAKVIIATNSQRKSEHLGDMHLSEYPSHAFLVGCEALFCISKKHYSDIFCGLVGEVGCVLPYSQNRTLGFKDHLLSPLAWSHLRLLGQSGVPGVVPAANVLTKRLSISPRTFGNFSMVLDGRFSCLDIAVGYHANTFEREKVTYNDTPWKENTYALPKDNYNSTTNFDGTANAVFGNNTFITVDGLDFAPATAEGFLAHTMSAGVALSGVLNALHLRIATGASFTFASVAVQQAWSASAGLFISF